VVDPLMQVEAAPAGGGGQRQTTGNPPLVFPSIDAAMASFAKLNNPPRISHDRERALSALVSIDGTFMLKRDPDNGNATPIGEGAAMPRRPRTDVWQDLAKVTAPTMVVRGLRSDRWDNPAVLARLTKDYTKIAIVTVDAQHDVADQAPDALIAHVRKFTGTI
jgi:pimeloyl-ACP methyl ester carboxylesterase